MANLNFGPLERSEKDACCCDYIATPRKSEIFCDPEAQFGQEK